jgi:hypothetical protein
MSGVCLWWKAQSCGEADWWEENKKKQKNCKIRKKQKNQFFYIIQ